MSPIHQSAAIGFDRGGADYERGRPGYPEAAIEILARELGLGPGKRIVDLAAGTGKLTRALVPLGADLIAVEPVAGMRAQLERAVPGVEILDGTAERIPLAAATADAVTVAQAFHWFDAPVAAAEIHRVLVPSGGLAVVRNRWDRSVPWVDEMQALIGERRPPDHPSGTRTGWRDQVQATGLFTPWSEATVDNEVRADLDTLLAREASISFVAALPALERERLLDDLRQLLQRHGIIAGEPLIMPHRTQVLWCRRRDG